MSRIAVFAICAMLITCGPASAAASDIHPRHTGDQVASSYLIELILTTCREIECRDVSMLYSPYEMSLMTCMVVGQRVAVGWVAQHPGWSVRRWICQFHGKRDVSA